MCVIVNPMTTGLEAYPVKITHNKLRATYRAYFILPSTGLILEMFLTFISTVKDCRKYLEEKSKSFVREAGFLKSMASYNGRRGFYSATMYEKNEVEFPQIKISCVIHRTDVMYFPSSTGNEKSFRPM